MRRLCSSFAAILILAGHLYAQEIVGAFGVLLGEEVRAQTGDVTRDPAGFLVRTFSPVIKSSIFDTYFYALTPSSRRVCSITAYGKAKHRREIDALVAELKAPRSKLSVAPDGSEVREWIVRKGSRSIILQVRGDAVMLLHIDNVLVLEATEEARRGKDV